MIHTACRSLGVGTTLLTLMILSSSAVGQSLSLDGTFTWINAGRYSVLNEANPLNPGNALLEVPRVQMLSEFRPNFEIVGNRIRIMARPRVRFLWQEVKAGQENWRDEGLSEAKLNEAFASWLLSDRLTFTLGLHSFQWGPTESLSPSNRIFHETALARDVVYEVRGKHLARVNFSLGQSLSLVVLSEYDENTDEAAFVAEEAFGSTTAVKGEVNWGGGANYFGVVIGGRQHGRPWVGEYASFSLPVPDGLILYFDVAHERQPRVYYPKKKVVDGGMGTGEIVVLEQSLAGNDVKTLAVLGLRYDFVQGSILRAEYISNEAGYSEEQQDLTRKALVSSEPLQMSVKGELLTRALASGLELPGKRYVYGSLYMPDFLALKDLTATIRTLVSVTDQSSNSYLSVEYEVGDAGTVFAASTVNQGKKGSELVGFTKETYMGGYRYIW